MITISALRSLLPRPMTRLRAIGRDQVVRRLAFGLELLDRVRWRQPRPPHVARPRSIEPSDCSLLAVVAHWRGPGAGGPETNDPLLACLRGLVDLPVRLVEIVVTTNADSATIELLQRELGAEVAVGSGRWHTPGTSAARITVEQWSPRWPRRHGFFLTWHHKDVFRRGLRAAALTHFLYVEDDISFTAENLSLWLSARGPLAERGLLPGFVRFERFEGERVLVDQTSSGQHDDGGPPFQIPPIGSVEVRISRRPYQACVLLDRALAEDHLHRSALRSPFRSNVVRWDLRERAAAGATFGPTPRLFSAFLRPQSARPVARNAVLVASRPGCPGTLVEGTLIEHLRKTYSRDPASRHGKVLVKDF